MAEDHLSAGDRGPRELSLTGSSRAARIALPWRYGDFALLRSEDRSAPPADRPIARSARGSPAPLAVPPCSSCGPATRRAPASARRCGGPASVSWAHTPTAAPAAAPHPASPRAATPRRSTTPTASWRRWRRSCWTERIAAVVPVDEDIVRLLALRGREIDGPVIVGPNAHQYATLCDKLELTKTAQYLGLDVPATVLVDDRGPDGPWPGLPSIVKPQTSPLGGGEADGRRDAAERDAYVGELVAGGHAAIVQERILGPRRVIQSVRGPGASSTWSSRWPTCGRAGPGSRRSSAPRPRLKASWRAPARSSTTSTTAVRAASASWSATGALPPRRQPAPGGHHRGLHPQRLRLPPPRRRDGARDLRRTVPGPPPPRRPHAPSISSSPPSPTLGGRAAKGDHRAAWPGRIVSVGSLPAGDARPLTGQRPSGSARARARRPEGDTNGPPGGFRPSAASD